MKTGALEKMKLLSSVLLDRGVRVISKFSKKWEKSSPNLFKVGACLGDDHDHDHDHPDIESCHSCEATWFDGEITGDPGCFSGNVEPIQTDKTCCHTERLTLERDGQKLYHILRTTLNDEHDDDHHLHDDEVRVTKVKLTPLGVRGTGEPDQFLLSLFTVLIKSWK